MVPPPSIKGDKAHLLVKWGGMGKVGRRNDVNSHIELQNNILTVALLLPSVLSSQERLEVPTLNTQTKCLTSLTVLKCIMKL